jgi:hypothetical protein
MANVHTVLDRVPMVVSSVFPKYFRDGIESPTVWDQIEAVSFHGPDLTAPGDHPVQADTAAGQLAALVRVQPCANPTAPVIIYHHGAKEFDTSFQGIFGKGPALPYHLVLVRAPFHDGFRQFLYGIGSLARYLALYAVSVRLIDEVIRQFRGAGCGSVSVTGTSLGGFVSLVHHIRFNTADAYMPLLAGPNLAHCLLESAYSRQTDRHAKGSAYVAGRLDFSAEYARVDHANVFPLLGRYDQLVMPAANAAAYGTTPVRLMDKGHFTGSTAFAELRAHILKMAA